MCRQELGYCNQTGISVLACSICQVGLSALRSLSQRCEIVVVNESARWGQCALEEQAAQTLTILIVADQCTHIFAARAIAPLRYLLIDEMLQASGSEIYIVVIQAFCCVWQKLAISTHWPWPVPFPETRKALPSAHPDRSRPSAASARSRRRASCGRACGRPGG